MSFEDIKGQDKALRILKENVARDAIFSSYLFVGPDGVGKFLTARIFAKAINCMNKKVNLSAEAKHNKYLAKAKPCGICLSCKKIDSGTHPDVFLLEPKGVSSSITIDQIRTVINRANLKPYGAGKKVFVIDSAHSMNAEAANAFLKTLEEAPKDTVFVLISRSKELLLSTIVSRCYSIKFSAAAPELVESVLAEKFSVGKNEAKILGNFSSGCIGQAIKMKEEGLIERKNRIIDSLVDTKKDFPAEISNYSRREELKENLEFLISYFRDIFLYKTVGNEDTIFHVDRIEEITAQCNRFTPDACDYLIEEIIKLRSYIDYNVNPKIIVDVLSNKLKKGFKEFACMR